MATNDGYWQGRSREEIASTIHSYLPDCHLEFRPDSHLWVVNPTNLTAVFGRLQERRRNPLELFRNQLFSIYLDHSLQIHKRCQ